MICRGVYFERAFLRVFFSEKRLPVNIGQLNAVIVHEPETPDACADEQFRNPGTKTADADNEGAAAGEPTLALLRRRA